jgi:hypothetical protein
MTVIDRSMIASMIYGIYQNSGSGIGFTEGKPNVINPKSCFDCIKEGLKTYFVPEANKTEVVIQSEPEASDSKTVNISKSKVVNNSESKTSKIHILKRPEPKS